MVFLQDLFSCQRTTPALCAGNCLEEVEQLSITHPPARRDAPLTRLKPTIRLPDTRRKQIEVAHGSSEAWFGGAGRNRTDDPLLAKQVLSQLSYSPIRDG